MQIKATQRDTVSLSLQERLAASLVLGLLGIFIVWGVGFAQPDLLHNAAHDSRHSMAFPCH